MKILLRDVLLDGSKKSILLENGKISRIAPEIAISAAEIAGVEIFDAGGRLAVMPPFYNAHNHAAMTLLRGYAEDLELFDWLSNHIWPVEARLSAEDIYIGTKLAAVEMIRSGSVYFNDSYWHPEASLRAVQESGMRATLGLLYLGNISPDAQKAN